jgi:hypothetical protein
MVGRLQNNELDECGKKRPRPVSMQAKKHNFVMKSYINRRFGGKFRLHLQGERINQARNRREAEPASRWFLTWFILPTWMSPPKRRLTFDGLHDVISQKMELFITTAVRT